MYVYSIIYICIYTHRAMWCVYIYMYINIYIYIGDDNPG